MRESRTWREFDVGWDSLHDSGSEGSHHARVARFLREHEVEAVVAHHMGEGMRHMLGKMELIVRLGASGNAKESAVQAAGVDADDARRSR